MPANDLNQLVVEAVAITCTPEYLQDKVKKHVDEIVKDALREALSSYGETGKLIKAAVVKALQVNDLDLPDYGFMVTQMVQAKVKEHVAEMVQGTLAADMVSLLSLAPKTIRLSEIVASMFADDNAVEEVFCELEPASTDSSSRWLYLSPEHLTSASKHRADVRLLISKDGIIRAGWLSEKDLKTSKSFGNFYGLEQKIRAYYACGTVIDLDEENVITEKTYD